MEIPFAAKAIAGAFILACWLTDLRSRSIPNLLTASAFLAGLLVQYLHHSLAGVSFGLAGAVLNVLLLLAPWCLGGVGGGDVKMMGAFGALVGPQVALYGLAAGLALGGVFAVVHLVRIGRLQEKAAATLSMITRAVRGRSAEPLRLSAAAPDAVALPYSLPLGAGALAAMVLLPAS